MPEEISRVLTDSICDLLFTTERAANENLVQEGRTCRRERPTRDPRARPRRAEAARGCAPVPDRGDRAAPQALECPAAPATVRSLQGHPHPTEGAKRWARFDHPSAAHVSCAHGLQHQ